MRTKQSKERLISIHFTDRLSPKRAQYCGFWGMSVGLETDLLPVMKAQKSLPVSSDEIGDDFRPQWLWGSQREIRPQGPLITTPIGTEAESSGSRPSNMAS